MSTKGRSVALIEELGVSIYVYFIIEMSYLSKLAFTMDGQQVGTFTTTPSSQNESFEFNVLVFSSTNLENVAHALNISTTGTAPSIMLFDYLYYT